MDTARIAKADERFSSPASSTGADASRIKHEALPFGARLVLTTIARVSTNALTCKGARFLTPRSD
jgi:hypothetical protein